MFSRLRDLLWNTAAWRFCVAATAVFGLGTAIAFAITYQLIARSVSERDDTWLRGETELLAEVVDRTRGSEAEALVLQAAELAMHEISPGSESAHPQDRPAFFVWFTSAGNPRVWHGPAQQEPFLRAIRKKSLPRLTPRWLEVEGWPAMFRVVADDTREGGRVMLGLSDESARALLAQLSRTLWRSWVVLLLVGFATAWLSARGLLYRMERITATAAAISSRALDQRVSEGKRNDEISRLADTFNGMLERIEEGVRQIRGVTDVVAHDLRSPLTAIRGNLELILTSDCDEAARERVTSAMEQLDRMLVMVNTTLDIAEADAGALALHRSRVEFQDLIDEMIEIFQPAADTKGLTLANRTSRQVSSFVDGELVRRALCNLLDNAIQHLTPGHRVDVEAIQRSAGVEVTVADDGPGFSDELREHAFDRFVRGPHSEGFGIGLSLVRAAARAHGGEALIEDRPGGGALIRVTFPAQELDIPGAA